MSKNLERVPRMNGNYCGPPLWGNPPPLGGGIGRGIGTLPPLRSAPRDLFPRHPLQHLVHKHSDTQTQTFTHTQTHGPQHRLTRSKVPTSELRTRPCCGTEKKKFWRFGVPETLSSPQRRTKQTPPYSSQSSHRGHPILGLLPAVNQGVRSAG